MTAPTPDHRPDTPPRWQPASPHLALVPGGLLVFLGLWAVADGELMPLGWAMFALGLALLLPAAVAHGVSWGMAIHDARR